MSKEVVAMAEVPGADFLRAVEGFERRVARLAGLVNAAHGELVDLVAEALDEGFAAGWGAGHNTN